MSKGFEFSTGVCWGVLDAGLTMACDALKGPTAFGNLLSKEDEAQLGQISLQLQALRDRVRDQKHAEVMALYKKKIFKQGLEAE